MDALYKLTLSQQIQMKFTTEDISLATARAEKFLVEYGVRAYSRLTANDVIKLLADYDLFQLDEMFNEAGGQG